MERSIKNTLYSLLTSRKFWLAFIAAVVAIVLYVNGAITAEQLAETFTVLGGVLVAASAAEDSAEKFNRPTINAPSSWTTTTNTPSNWTTTTTTADIDPPSAVE